MGTNVWAIDKVCEACDKEYEPESPRQKLCKVCAPEKSWVTRYRRYKITKPQFDALLEKQNGDCPLCGDLLMLDINTCVDHCHNSLRVRGILCRGCNMVVARFEDEDYKARVLKYLEEGDLPHAEEKEMRNVPGFQI